MLNVFLLLGSNLGNRQQFLSEAITAISVEIAPIAQASAVYETQAWGKTDEPDYLNQVVMLSTALPAHEILEKVLDIELRLGRRRAEKWGARTLDIDILFYGNEVIDEPNLIVPHPQLQNRRFTLEPLAEIAPTLAHPVLNKTITQLKSELQDCLVIKKL